MLNETQFLMGGFHRSPTIGDFFFFFNTKMNVNHWIKVNKPLDQNAYYIPLRLNCFLLF